MARHHWTGQDGQLCSSMSCGLPPGAHQLAEAIALAAALATASATAVAVAPAFPHAYSVVCDRRWVQRDSGGAREQVPLNLQSMRTPAHSRLSGYGLMLQRMPWLLLLPSPGQLLARLPGQCPAQGRIGWLEMWLLPMSISSAHARSTAACPHPRLAAAQLRH